MSSLVHRLRCALAEKALWRATKELTRHSDYFVTFHRRPKYSNDVGTWSDPDLKAEHCAIVMQGPPHLDDDFTVETLKLYRQHYPTASLYLSTWKDSDRSVLARIASLDVKIVLSDRPRVPGLFNLNMQLVTAHAGVSAACDDGAEWVLKTRTDQRLYATNALSFLVALAEQFPPRGASIQKHRVIGVGRGTLKYAPYHLSDQTVFGSSQDMLLYWSAPLREDPTPAKWPGRLADVYHSVPLLDLCQRGAAESYLTSQFLHRLGRPLHWTIEDSWAAFRDHFCVADYETTDLYWPKAQVDSLQEYGFDYRCVDNRREFGFRDWLLLFSGALQPEMARTYEDVLRTKFVSAVPSSAPSDRTGA